MQMQKQLLVIRFNSGDSSRNTRVFYLSNGHKSIRLYNNCIGKAYNLSTPIGDYFKIYIGTPAAYAEKWHFSGYVTRRFDF